MTGRVATGLGKGNTFTTLGWVRKQLIEKLGIEPFPGTLNIKLDDPILVSKWQALLKQSPYTIKAPDNKSCDALCQPVIVNAKVVATIISPLVEGYPENQLELIAPVCLRETLNLEDKDSLKIEVKHTLSASTIVFDLDGTLLDTIEAFYILAKRSGDEYGIQMDRKHVHGLLNHGRPYWENAVSGSEKEREETILKLNHRARELWPEIVSAHAGVFTGVADTLLSLKEKGFKLGIVTGSGKDSVDLLYSVGVESLFDAVVTREQVKVRKPHPAGLLLCLSKLGVRAEQAIYVGDTSIDMQAARSAGMSAVGVLSGAGSSADLCLAGAQRIITDHALLPEIVFKY